MNNILPQHITTDSIKDEQILALLIKKPFNSNNESLETHSMRAYIIFFIIGFYVFSGISMTLLRLYHHSSQHYFFKYQIKDIMESEKYNYISKLSNTKFV